MQSSKMATTKIIKTWGNIYNVEQGTMKLCVYCGYNYMKNICKGDNTGRKYDKMLPRIVLVNHGCLFSLLSKYSDS